MTAGGCSGIYSKLGKVSGRVTLAGQPLADALVTFAPVQGGSGSMGRTDSDGKYVLAYVRNVNGAEAGEHNVTISTFQEGNTDTSPPTPDIPEKVPLKYRTAGELKATVKKGSNTIDFALDPGPIEAPKPEKGKGKAAKPRPKALCF